VVDREQPALDLLTLLYESEEVPAFDLPAELSRLYGGPLGFADPRLYANFVSTLDGVVAIPSIPQSNKLINQGSEADRFVMGLLRACADAIVIGTGTLHGSPRGTWTPERAYPPAAAAFAELRQRLDRPPVPQLTVLSRSGSFDVSHPVLERGALVVTTDRGADALRRRLPAASDVVSLGADVDPPNVVGLLRDRGHSRILSESGPTVFGAFLEAGLVDELFLTVSPLLAGRTRDDDRLQLVEDVAFLPDKRVAGRLLSVRSSGAQLFLRYGFRP
jgi:riboflavin biosynthesis pyrimidine reductase